MNEPDTSAGLPWRSTGTQRSWGGKSELPKLHLELVASGGAAFEGLVRNILRLALAPPDRLLSREHLQSLEGGLLAHAGEMGMPVFVQPIAFQECSEDLGEPQALRCHEAIERFAHSPLAAEVYLLVHNRDPRSSSFRNALKSQIAAFRNTGRVAHVLVWDSRDLLEAAFDGLFDLTRSFACQGRLSVASVDTALVGSAGLLATVPLRVSWLAADQHRMNPDEDSGSETTADPAHLLLEAAPSVRTFLLGEFGFGKTTALARSLMQEDLRILYVPGAAFSREVGATKLFLSHCIETEPLLADCDPEERNLYKRMLPSVIDHLFKDENLPCVLVIDGLDESPVLCRGAGLTHLINYLEKVRIPVVLAMRSEYWRSRRGDLISTAGTQQSRGEPRRRRIRKLELLSWHEGEILRFVQRFRETCRDPGEWERLGNLESFVAEGRFSEIYGDIPKRPLFLRLIAESAAREGIPAQRIGRARLFHNWALQKICRDLSVARPHLVFDGEPTEEVLETAWEAMLHAAASMTQEHKGELDLLPDCSFERVRQATPRLAKMVDVLALSLQSLLLLSNQRTGVQAPRVSFAHRAFQEFFLAWFLAEGYLDRQWVLPSSVGEWIEDLRREGLLDPEGRRESERPPGLPPAPTRPMRWAPPDSAGSIDRGPLPESPDLILHVLERAGGRRRLFELRLTARDPELGLHERPYGTIEMETDPAEFFRQHLKEVAEGESLRARGAFFSEQLLPPDLRKKLSELRHRAPLLQIVSDDASIPWEILRIEESPASGVIDGPFLAEAFSLTRWFHPIRDTGFLPLSRIAAVIPRDSELPHAEQEWDDLRNLTGGERQVERIPARLRDLEEAFRSGTYDGWHFTGHGLFRGSSPDLSAILLEGGESLTPPHLGGESKRIGRKRPLVFLNGCETGRIGLSLTDLGGWGPCFLRAGAGGFIGTLWEVRDSRSREFARVFYAAFLGGLALAEAVRVARQAIRSESDPTWLAYAVFGHPRAVCRPVPGRE